MNRDRVLVPVVGVGLLYVVAQGWLTTLWQHLYALTHTGAAAAPSDPFSKAQGGSIPVITGITGGAITWPGAQFVPWSGQFGQPITVGTGGDALNAQLPGLPPLILQGTKRAIYAGPGSFWSGPGTPTGYIFTPSDSRILPFTVGPSTDPIPLNTLLQAYGIGGISPDRLAHVYAQLTAPSGGNTTPSGHI